MLLIKDAGKYEPAGDEIQLARSRVPVELVNCITHVVSPQNPRMPVLKTVITSACERDCHYCGMRSGRDCRRVTFTPEEMAKGFYNLYRAGLVEGMFLSSGVIANGIWAQDRIIATAEILRLNYKFKGYLHLKIMPAAEYGQIVRTMQLADRVSVNLEAPNPERLARLAPQKQFGGELMQRLQWIEEIRQAQGGRGPSSTTQFVVGPAGESDLELLQTTQYLNQNVKIGRAYFMAFNPILDTPLENVAPTSERRKHRLFQGSFLLRDYDFDVEELPFDPTGNLPLNKDPKMAWACDNLIHQPVEINRAERRDLLRVPGIGPKGADRILKERRRGTLRELEELYKIGVLAGRAAPYVTLA
ncbi:MAG: radical SAM protein, partial [Anaerolineales bacterium]|nr:radical SAM protein [Anaerolineales bacterium]